MENTAAYCDCHVVSRRNRRTGVENLALPAASVARRRISWGLSGASTSKKRWNLLHGRQIQLPFEPRHKLYDHVASLFLFPSKESQAALVAGDFRLWNNIAELLQPHLCGGSLSVRYFVRFAHRDNTCRIGDLAGQEVSSFRFQVSGFRMSNCYCCRAEITILRSFAARNPKTVSLTSSVSKE